MNNSLATNTVAQKKIAIKLRNLNEMRCLLNSTLALNLDFEES